MNAAVPLGRHRVDGPIEGAVVWEQELTAFPTASAVTSDLGIGREGVQARLFGALVNDISRLAPGEWMRFTTSFGARTCESSISGSGVEPEGGDFLALGAVAGLGPRTPVRTPLPPIGGALITQVVLVDHTDSSFVPWTRLVAPGLQGAEDEDRSIWTGLVERLTANRLPVAVVVDIQRRGVPSRSQDALAAGLEARAQQRGARRSRPVGGRVDERGPRRALAGDYSVTIGLVGDAAAFTSAWRSETGFSLRVPSGLPSATARDVRSQVSADVAARLIPLPVIEAHSAMAIARFTPRSTAVTRPMAPGTAVRVARTDVGQDIGLDPRSVNRHLLVVGDTGTGKSVTTMSLLSSLWNDFGIPWLVIDPLKSEYARLEVAAGPVRIEGTTRVRHLRLGEIPLNPLVVPAGVDRLAFASAMAQAFSAASALGENFPLGDQIARTAFNQLFDPPSSATHAPTFADLEAALTAACHREGLSGETLSNIRISLLGRLGAMTSGAAGDVFAGGPQAGLDWEELSRFPTVVTFPVGTGQHEKSVIYALLVAAHSSWRLANPTGSGHLLVLEEVHQVFGRTNPIAAPVLDSLLATMRAAGQGYLAVTQTPHQLAEQTQRSFQRIIAHRTVHCAGLDALQALGPSWGELRDLDDGEVLVMLGERHGARGRVSDRTVTDPGDPMRPVASHRATEFLRSGPVVRGWCASCPAPCQGRSWLGLGRPAAAAASEALASGSSVRVAAEAAVEAVVRAAAVDHPSVRNTAGVYCAAARGVTVALGVRGASDASARAAAADVRSLISSRGDETSRATTTRSTT